MNVVSLYKSARKKRWVRWTTDVVFIVVLFAGVTAWQSRGLVGGGQLAPEFALTDLNGKTWRSAELRGKKIVLEFWAPWCGVCGAQSSALSSLRKSVGDDIEVLSVAVSFEELEDVKRFVEKNDADYPVLLGDDRIQDAYRVSSFPTTYFIDEDGEVRHTAVGYTTGFGLRWRTWF